MRPRRARPAAGSPTARCRPRCRALNDPGTTVAAGRTRPAGRRPHRSTPSAPQPEARPALGVAARLWRMNDSPKAGLARARREGRADDRQLGRAVSTVEDIPPSPAKPVHAARVEGDWAEPPL